MERGLCIEAIDKFPSSTNTKELMRFPGMAGYNSSVIVHSITNLLEINSNLFGQIKDLLQQD